MKRREFPEVERVKLKSFKGIRPGLWITLIFFSALIFILFLILVLPGLISKSAYAHFNFPINGVAIYENGVYLGSDSSEVLRVKSGESEYEFYLGPYFLKSERLDAKKAIWASLYRRKINQFNIEFDFDDLLNDYKIERFAKEIASWTKVIDYDERYHFPPLYSEFAEDAVSMKLDNISSVWLYGAEHVTSMASYSDYLKGREILSDSNLNYSSEELESLDKILSQMFGEEVSESLSLDNPTYSQPSKDGSYYQYDDESVLIGKKTILRYPDTNEYPVIVRLEPFKMAEKLVSEADYKRFIDENPYWSKANITALIEDEMADENYLRGVTFSRSNSEITPIRSISYYAALAYVSWLSQKEGKEYSLPSEAEWTLAAKLSDKSYVKVLRHTDLDQNSPSSLMGQLWEFTDTPYIPLMRVAGYEKAIELENEYPYDDAIIKGGSYINDPTAISVDTVGIMDKSRTSDYVGFRIVEHER